MKSPISDEIRRFSDATRATAMHLAVAGVRVHFILQRVPGFNESALLGSICTVTNGTMSFATPESVHQELYALLSASRFGRVTVWCRIGSGAVIRRSLGNGMRARQRKTGSSDFFGVSSRNTTYCVEIDFEPGAIISGQIPIQVCVSLIEQGERRFRLMNFAIPCGEPSGSDDFAVALFFARAFTSRALEEGLTAARAIPVPTPSVRSGKLCEMIREKFSRISDLDDRIVETIRVRGMGIFELLAWLEPRPVWVSPGTVLLVHDDRAIAVFGQPDGRADEEALVREKASAWALIGRWMPDAVGIVAGHALEVAGRNAWGHPKRV